MVRFKDMTKQHSSGKVYGILPMAGKGSRIQRLGFPKELYPVVYKQSHFAVSEFSVRAMTYAGVDEIKLVINGNKLEIAKYYTDHDQLLSLYIHAQAGKSLPDACLLPLPSIHDDDLCLFGLPDTIFQPFDSYKRILTRLQGGADMVLGLFSVANPESFDSVALSPKNEVIQVLVKKNPPLSSWIWGIWGANGRTLRKLRRHIDTQQAEGERLLGVGFDSLIKSGECVVYGEKLGADFFDVGTMDAVLKVHQVIKDFSIDL